MLEALAKKPFRELLEMASRTTTESNIRPLRSLDQLAKSALELTQNVVEAQCKRDRLSDAYKHEREVAMAYLEKLDSEFEREITAADVALHQAEMKRREAQWRLLRQIIETGVMEGVSDLKELARSQGICGGEVMEETFDADTGELPLTSERAIAAREHRDVAEEAELLGTGKVRIMSALMAAVTKLPVWITTDKPGAHNIKYATLKQILETVRPALLDQGIRIRQGVDRSYPLDDGHGKGRLVIIYTDLIHGETAEVERTIVEIPVVKMDAQAMGSAITYGRRYSLLAALGLATDEADDDGEGAKSKTIADRSEKTVELVALLKEVSAFKSATDLAEWGHDKKQTQRLNRLTEVERALAHEAYNTKAQELLTAMDAPDDDKPAKGKGSKA